MRAAPERTLVYGRCTAHGRVLLVNVRYWPLIGTDIGECPRCGSTISAEPDLATRCQAPATREYRVEIRDHKRDPWRGYTEWTGDGEYVLRKLKALRADGAHVRVVNRGPEPPRAA